MDWQKEIIEAAERRDLYPEDIVSIAAAAKEPLTRVARWIARTRYLTVNFDFGMNPNQADPDEKFALVNSRAKIDWQVKAALGTIQGAIPLKMTWSRSKYNPRFRKALARGWETTSGFRGWVKLHACPLSLLLSLIVYAGVWGISFAVGFLTMLGIHEMGHKVAAKRVGIETSEPFFWPWLGAFISIKKMPDDAWKEAVLGIGGPLIGSAAALLALYPPLFGWGNPEFWYTLALVGVAINLLNLIPMRPLDGGRITGVISHWFMMPALLFLVYKHIRALFPGGPDWPYPIWTLLMLIGILEFFSARKKAREAGYLSKVPWTRRVGMASLWVALVSILGGVIYFGYPILENMKNPESLTLIGGTVLARWAFSRRT